MTSSRHLLEVSPNVGYRATYMAQAWHKRRQSVAPAHSAGAKRWRATDYKLDNTDNPRAIEATPDATWERFAPLDLYRPTSKAREVEEAGPHLTFLRLKHVWETQQPIFPKALILFAREYGLLGAFEEDYLPDPVFPEGKMLIAPEAVIDDRDRLRRLDPGTEGRELLLDLLEPREWFWSFKDKKREAGRNCTALPSEVLWNSKNPGLDSELWPSKQPRQLVRWEEIQEDFGALLVLDKDEETFKGVSVLCTREPVRRWTVGLRFFPSGDTPIEDLAIGSDYGTSLNHYLQEVSPYAFLGRYGNLERGWEYRSLLQAMYVMLFLDLTGGNAIKKCQSRGCPNYFRVGSQSRSRYCSERCANRASTRMRRGQEP
jgi:hypothetical protein